MTTERRSTARTRIGLALFVGVLAITITYAGLRAGEVLFRHEAAPDPMIVSGNVALFTRLAVGAYVAGPAAALTYFVAGDLERGERLARAVFAVAAALALVQGIFLP